MTESVLAKVSDVAGVIGVALIEPDGRCSAEALAPPYEAVLVSEAAKALRAARECYCGIDGLETVRTLAVRSAQGHIVVRNVRERDLLVICSSSANLAMVNIALNVAELKLASLPRSGSFASVSPASPAPNSSARVATPPAPPPETPRAMNWTDSSRRGTGVGLRVMRHLLRTFEDHVGPQAQVLLEAELRRVGATPEDLDAARFADLIRAAARHVPDPERRKKFVNEVLGDTRRRR